MYRSVRNIPKQLLENLYVKEGWTLRDVADYIGCSVDTVVRRMDDYNILRRTKRKDISRATLVSLYEDNHASIDTLAHRFNVSAATISNRLHEYGVLCTHPHSIHSINPERIKKSYESGNSTSYIANMTGLTRWKVLHILRHMGVSIRGGRRKVLPIEEMNYLYTYHGMSTKDIGVAYQLQANTVALYLRESGVSLRGKRLEIDENEIRRLRMEGVSIAAIAQRLECSTSVVRNRLKRH